MNVERQGDISDIFGNAIYAPIFSAFGAAISTYFKEEGEIRLHRNQRIRIIRKLISEIDEGRTDANHLTRIALVSVAQQLRGTPQGQDPVSLDS